MATLPGDGINICHQTSLACASVSFERRARFEARPPAPSNILIYDYIGIDLDEVWTAVERDMPQLKTAVLALLGDRSTRD
jgi:hypothetical protein